MENRLTLTLLAAMMSIPAMAQSKLGFEFTFSGYSNTVSVPGMLSYITSVADGSGSNTSYGVTLVASEKITLRGGLSFWSMPFSPTIQATVGGQPATAYEEGTLSYSGVYFRIDRTLPYFFFTGGFDLSFSNSYKGSYKIESAGGSFANSGTTESLLTNDFNNQFNLVLGLGPSIPIGKHLLLRGLLSGTVVVRGIYDSGVTATNQVYISTGTAAPDDTNVDLHYLPFLSYGFSLQYTIAGRK
jgi:hypothetical protein